MLINIVSLAVVLITALACKPETKTAATKLDVIKCKDIELTGANAFEIQTNGSSMTKSQSVLITSEEPEPEVSGQPTQNGGLTQQEVLAPIRANLNAIKACYESALERNPDAQGVLTTRFVIGESGKVKSACIKAVSQEKCQNICFDAEMQRCIVNQVLLWTFAKPRKVIGIGTDVFVTYPFSFHPK